MIENLLGRPDINMEVRQLLIRNPEVPFQPVACIQKPQSHDCRLSGLLNNEYSLIKTGILRGKVKMKPDATTIRYNNCKPAVKKI